MHLQQTKKESAATGGPQYYFHDLSKSVKTLLRHQGAVPVALVTPYGATKSHFTALSKDHKLNAKQEVVAGSVGHDRVQQGSAGESIGEAIRRWYRLKQGQFDRIEIEIFDDDAFYLRPTNIRYSGSSIARPVRKIDRPLTFTHKYVSQLWREQLHKLAKRDRSLAEWSVTEIIRVAGDHRPASRIAHVQEPDLLRASGPLKHFGLSLGAYVGKGYDCQSDFEFLDFPAYRAPVEIKRNSSGFRYQQKKYGKAELSRAVVLCAIDDHQTVPPNIDIIELDAFAKFGRDELSLKL